jgi:lipopolysaccharide/colanic/teichoic acid biosynthesis glycosyltransferase
VSGSAPGPYRGKRAFDLVLVAVAALPAAVVGGLGALAVRLSSRGPVLFRQERVGRDGEPFSLLKLRTMRADGPNPVFPDADRTTPVGKVLRRTSVDELPQLWNVARGDMSVVGPRPTLGYQVARYSERQRGRLAVRPGLTGLAQVRLRNAAPWAERIELDLDYVERQSLALDVRILVRSVLVVLQGALGRGGGVGGHPADDPIARPPEP